MREIEFIKDGVEVGVLSERRAFEPYGMEGGGNGARGINLIEFPDGRIINFGGKNTISLVKGCKIKVLTPGGGGFGKKE